MNSLGVSVVLCTALLTHLACQTNKSADTETLEADDAFVGVFSIPYPDTIRYPNGAPTESEIALGRSLFFDKRLSPGGDMACSSCHDPGKGYSNRTASGTSHGPGYGYRRTPPHLYNLAWSTFFYWDGRVTSLEDQALSALVNPAELANKDPAEVVVRLSAVPAYVKKFEAAFGSGPSSDLIGRALAAFERSIISNNSPFDQYLKGNTQAMSAGAVRGMGLFLGKAHCGQCHNGPNLTNNEFHNTGVVDDDPGFHYQDRQGPKELAFTPYPFFATSQAFKTPGLRNVALTAPYFHDGSAPTLDDVVEFYNQGSKRPGTPGLARPVRPLGLTAAEKKDLVEFMQNLTFVVDPGEVHVP